MPGDGKDLSVARRLGDRWQAVNWGSAQSADPQSCVVALMLVRRCILNAREYAGREAEFLLDPTRFNVAITRPRSRLIVFLSEDVLRTVPQDDR
mgnify:CR=1 FL=1